MTSKFQPYRIYPHPNISVISSPNENIVSNNNPISQSDVKLIPLSPKPKKSRWPHILWFGLGILIFLCLVIIIVVPIVALANQGETTTTTASTTTISTICPTTSVTSTITASALPAQCSSYTTISDDTRSPDYYGASSCDTATFSTTPYWVRFVGPGGTLLATCPIDIFRCGTDSPGWYAGLHPSIAGDVTSGYVCYNDNGNLCDQSNLILVTNCNGFYIYYLSQPPSCSLRYCTI